MEQLTGSKLGKEYNKPVYCQPVYLTYMQSAVHGVAKSRTRLGDFTFTFHFHELEKEMATHSSVLAWKIPGTAELGGLPSVGSHSQTQLKQFSSSSSSNIYLIMVSN